MKPDFTKSTETLALIELLSAAPIGGLVTYAAMSDAIGADIHEHRHYLTSAVKTLFGDGVAFGTVRRHGVKRLEAAEIPGIGDGALTRIKRTARRARHRMTAANGMNDLPNAVRIAINTSASLLGVIELFSDGKAKKKTQAQVQTAQSVIPPRKLLDALK